MTKVKDMTVEERRAYNRERKRARRENPDLVQHDNAVRLAYRQKKATPPDRSREHRHQWRKTEYANIKADPKRQEKRLARARSYYAQKALQARMHTLGWKRPIARLVLSLLARFSRWL